jgi:hypothetical protein
MPITVKHLKVSTVPDAGDDTLVEPSDWNADHTLTGLGTMAEQNANAVAITGGTISGVTLPASNITGTLGVPNGGTGATTLTGYVKGTGTTAMTAAATIPNTDITGLGTASTKDAGAALGVATLDASGKVPVSELPAAVLGALSYQGTWDAATNTPTLTSSVGTKGYYYVVSVAGNTNLNGITDWLVGDWAVYNGTVWQKVDNTETVTSVNGQTGAVVLTASSVGAVPTTRTITAGTGLTGGGDLSADRTFAIDSTVATLTGTQTLTNKTLTSPKVNEILDANGNEVLGLLSTASATDYVGIKNGIGVGVPLHISSEGSSANIGLHIQPKGTGLVTISDGTDFNKGIRFRSSGSAASAITLLDAVSSAGHVITLPDATTTLVGRGTTDTFTNKSISGSTNTLSNIGNSSLTNSAITINGTSTSLGGSINVGTVTSVDLTASTGISVSGGPITGSGSITVINTAPDQTVSIASGTGISASGTYPNFTVTNTGVTSAVAGTGISVSSGTGAVTVTNTAPDQTVAISSGTGISVTGTYPNFTVANTAPSSGGTVTSVAALTIGTTGTDLSSTVANGTTTPVITLQVPTASAVNRGALSSADWTTFNSKAPAVTYTTNYVPFGQGTTTPALSASFTYTTGTGALRSPAIEASNGLVVNNLSINTSYSIPSGYGASSVGPVVVASGVTITVPSGSRWVVL